MAIPPTRLGHAGHGGCGFEADASGASATAVGRSASASGGFRGRLRQPGAGVGYRRGANQDRAAIVTTAATGGASPSATTRTSAGTYSIATGVGSGHRGILRSRLVPETSHNRGCPKHGRQCHCGWHPVRCRALASAIAIGNNAIANAANAIAIGTNAVATGGQAVAIGGATTSPTAMAPWRSAIPAYAGGTGAFTGGANNIANSDGTASATRRQSGRRRCRDRQQQQGDRAGLRGAGQRKLDRRRAGLAGKGALGNGATAAASSGDAALGSGSVTATAVGTPSTVDQRHHLQLRRHQPDLDGQCRRRRRRAHHHQRRRGGGSAVLDRCHQRLAALRDQPGWSMELGTTVNNINTGGGIVAFHANSTLADPCARSVNLLPSARRLPRNGAGLVSIGSRRHRGRR